MKPLITNNLTKKGYIFNVMLFIEITTEFKSGKYPHFEQVIDFDLTHTLKTFRFCILLIRVDPYMYMYMYTHMDDVCIRCWLMCHHIHD
jgi:hypothetical protein